MNINQKILTKSYLEGQLVAQKITKRIPDDYAHSPGMNLRSSSHNDLAFEGCQGDEDKYTRSMKKQPGIIIPRENKSSIQRLEISNKFKQEKAEKDMMSLHLFNQMNRRNINMHKSLPHSMKALDKARSRNDLTTPAFVDPTKTKLSPQLTMSASMSMPSLLAAQIEQCDDKQEVQRLMRRPTTRKNLCKSDTYCEESNDGRVIFQTPLQRKETVIKVLTSAVDNKRETLMKQEFDIRGALTHQNPELIKDLADAANIMEQLVQDIKQAEEDVVDTTNKHAVDSKEKLSHDRIISKKLKKQLNGNILTHENSLKSIFNKELNYRTEGGKRIQDLKYKIEEMEKNIKSFETEFNVEKNILLTKMIEIKQEKEKVDKTNRKISASLLNGKDALYKFLTGSKDTSEEDITLVLEKFGYTGEVGRDMAVKICLNAKVSKGSRNQQ